MRRSARPSRGRHGVGLRRRNLDLRPRAIRRAAAELRLAATHPAPLSSPAARCCLIRLAAQLLAKPFSDDTARWPTLLYGLVKEHWRDFVQHAREAYEAPLPKYVVDEFQKYLACGDFTEGFVHVQCTSCGA